MSSQSRGLAAKGALVFWAASLSVIHVPAQAGELNFAEDFNCGTLGRVTLRSSKPSFSKKAGHTVSAATITIPIKESGRMGYFTALWEGTTEHLLAEKVIHSGLLMIQAFQIQ